MTNYPEELTPALRDVLSTMCFQCANIASILRASGQEIKRRAEDEQAAVLHYFIPFALKHGETWRDAVGDDLRARVDRAKSQFKQEG